MPADIAGTAHWVGSTLRVQRYQGEVVNKAEIQRRFRSKVKRTMGARSEGDDWNGIELLLRRVLHALDES
jgi:hypothetical protein